LEYLSTFSKEVLSFTVEVAIYKITLVIVTVKLESSVSGFHRVNEFTGIDDLTEVPRFFSLAVVLIVTPFSFIDRPCLVHVNSKAVCFAIDPLSLKNITI
jgi:hypothetical protein